MQESLPSLPSLATIVSLNRDTPWCEWDRHNVVVESEPVASARHDAAPADDVDLYPTLPHWRGDLVDAAIMRVLKSAARKVSTSSLARSVQVCCGCGRRLRGLPCLTTRVMLLPGVQDALRGRCKVSVSLFLGRLAMVGRRGWVSVTQRCYVGAGEGQTGIGGVSMSGVRRTGSDASTTVDQLTGEVELVNHTSYSDMDDDDGQAAASASTSTVDTLGNGGGSEAKYDAAEADSKDDGASVAGSSGALELSMPREPADLTTALAVMCAQVTQVLSVPHDVVEAWLVRMFQHS